MHLNSYFATPEYHTRSLPGEVIFQSTSFSWFSSFVVYSIFSCCLAAKLCLNLLLPHGLQPSSLFCPWGFPGKKYWSGLLSLSPGDLPNPRIKPASPVLAGGFFTTELPGKPYCIQYIEYKIKLSCGSARKESACNVADLGLILKIYNSTSYQLQHSKGQFCLVFSSRSPFCRYEVKLCCANCLVSTTRV